MPPSHNVHCLIIIPHLGSPSQVGGLPSTAHQAHGGLLHALPASHQALPPPLLPQPHWNPTPGVQISQILMDSSHGLSLTLTQAKCELQKQQLTRALVTLSHGLNYIPSKFTC